VFKRTSHHENVWGLGVCPALVGGEWSALRLCRFTPRERAHATRWKGGWVGARATRDEVTNKKYYHCSCCKSNPYRPARSLSYLAEECKQCFLEKCITAANEDDCHFQDSGADACFSENSFGLYSSSLH